MDLFSLLGAAPSNPSGALGDPNAVVVGESTIEWRIAKLMRGITLSRHDPAAVARIRRVVSRCDDDLCRMGAGLHDLRAAIKYVADETTLDRYEPYSGSIRLGFGDCSSMTVAMCAHAAVLGMPVAGCTIMQVNHETGLLEWSHVYSLAWPRIGRSGVRRRVAADVSEAHVPLGWEPQAWRVRGKRDWLYAVDVWDRWYAEGADENRLPSVT